MRLAGSLLLVLIFSALFWIWCSPNHRGEDDLELLLHGNQNILISRIEVQSYVHGQPVSIAITNSDALRFLAHGLSSSARNNAGSFYVFRSKIFFSDGHSTVTDLQLSDELSCIVVNIEPFWGDPVGYRFTLPVSIPPSLKSSLEEILRTTK